MRNDLSQYIFSFMHRYSKVSKTFLHFIPSKTNSRLFLQTIRARPHKTIRILKDRLQNFVFKDNDLAVFSNF